MPQEKKRAIDSLDPDEQAHLLKHKIEIAGVRQISDIYPTMSSRTAGIYDRENKIILVAEEVLKLGTWVKNDDIMFILRHEFGHAFNVTLDSFGEPISDGRLFRAAFSTSERLIVYDRR